MTMTAGSTAGGAVYDRGYRPYVGPRGGRGHARWALFRLTVRRAVGLRRSWRQKVMPWFLLALATVPAMINVGIKFATRDEPAGEVDIEFISYRDYFEVTFLLMVLFLALAAPDAVCPDRRQKTLSLMFSRPLTGVDYALAKVGAMAAVIFAFALFPQVVLFVGQAAVHEDGVSDYVGDTAEVLWQVPLAAVVLAVYFAAIGVAMSSLSGRRLVAGVAILGSWMITALTASIVVFANAQETTNGELGRDEGSVFALMDFFSMPLFLRDVIFLGHVDPGSALGGVTDGGSMALLLYLGVLAMASLVLLGRYREVKL